MRLSCTVFEIRRVICQNLPTWTYPTCIWHPRWGWPRSNFKKIFGIRKLESLGYRVCVFLCLVISVQLWLVTDGQTDRQTQGQSIYRASIASRGKNTCKCLQNRQRFSILIQRNISNTLKVCPGKNVQPTTKLHIISPTILVHNPFLLSHVDNMLRQNLGYSNPESKMRKILALQQRQCKQTENCSWHQHLSACSIQFVCQHLQKSQEDKTHPQPFSLCPN